MIVEIEYPAFATDNKDNVLTDSEVLSLISKNKDKNANLSDHLSSCFDDLGVSGGQVKLRTCPEGKFLRSIITYEMDGPLSEHNLRLLVEETSGQLTDGYGETPWKIKLGKEELFISLLDILSNENTPISISSINTPSLLKKARRSPLFSLIEKGEIEKARKYLDQSHLFSTEKWGRTPLMDAIREGYTELAIEMIKMGSNVNHVAEKSGAPPLSTAAMSGDAIIGQALIDFGADINHSSVDPDGTLSGMTALMWAANRNHKSFVKLLINNGANVNKINQNGQTSLMFANKGTPEQLEIFKLIIQKKPILDINDWRGLTIIDEARNRANNSGKPEMKNLIKEYYPEVNFES